MPLSAAHKQQTRAKIVETARKLFNRYGFEGVSIDDIMKASGLTRGGFYNHFRNKDELYAEAVSSFLKGRGAKWRSEAGITPDSDPKMMARQMLESYLSEEHLGDLEGQCPMIALPSDVARASPEVRSSYQELLSAMVWLYEHSLTAENPQLKPEEVRQKALTLAALSVGGMVLSRTLPDSKLANDIRIAAKQTAKAITHGAH